MDKSTLNPNKYDNFHIRMDYAILYGFTERNFRPEAAPSYYSLIKS